MPHSLRAKLSGLRYKGILADKDYKRLCKALDNEGVIEKIKAEIYQLHYHPKLDFIKNDEVVEMALDIIDRHRESEVRNERL
jgi:hypothetical protein